MWMFTTFGFFSAVCARCRPDGTLDRHGSYVDRTTLVVRARLREHLDRLIAAWPALLAGVQVEEVAGTDYVARIIVPAAVWRQVVGHMLDEVDYTNFKAAVQSREGATPYEQALHRVWGVGYGLQCGAHGPGIYSRPAPDPRWTGTEEATPEEEEEVRDADAKRGNRRKAKKAPPAG